MKTKNKDLILFFQTLEKGEYAGTWPRYDGRRKMFRGVNKRQYDDAYDKHVKRTVWSFQPRTQSELREAYNFILEWSKPEKGNYQKVAMYGKTHLYLASPVYGHQDYNKARVLPIAGHEKECEFLIHVSERVSGLNLR